jgi:hypothetical protein
MDTASIDHASVDELEQLFTTSPRGNAPTGTYAGRYLTELPPAHRQPRLQRAFDWLLFQRTPFGIDFDRRLWWFFHPRLAAGRFEISFGPSRWRSANAFRLDYHVSRLPIRGMLYDEVQPIDDDHCIGIGGANLGPREGDHFFFALTRVARARM